MDPIVEENGGDFLLFPKGSLEGKSNYKQYYVIRPDGTAQKRVFLDVIEDRDREKIICIHYIMWAAKHFLKVGDGIDIVKRDCPWDFELSINKKRRFFVEVTAVADNTAHHVINKREQRVAASRDQETITLHELKKLNYMFPDEEKVAAIEAYREVGLTDNSKVPNPFFGTGMQGFISFLPLPDMPLDGLLKSAIESKASKKHEGKERTVLILDNRTSLYDASNILAAVDELRDFLDGCPFREIWLYTGYFSNSDGQNSEYSFIALKLLAGRRRKIRKVLAKAPVDEQGRHLVSVGAKPRGLS